VFGPPPTSVTGTIGYINLHDLDYLTARRFHTGRVCLDFTHTGGVGEWMAAELLHEAEDLSLWLGRLLEVDGIRAGPRDLGPTRELRAAIWQLAQARVAGRPLPANHVATVNRHAAGAPLVVSLGPNHEARVVSPTARGARSVLARDAIDLFGGPLGHRIRECAAPDCQLLFVDASGPGRRRWCSMERCGNLAKVRAHRAGRSRASPSQ